MDPRYFARGCLENIRKSKYRVIIRKSFLKLGIGTMIYSKKPWYILRRIL